MIRSNFFSYHYGRTCPPDMPFETLECFVIDTNNAFSLKSVLLSGYIRDVTNNILVPMSENYNIEYLFTFDCNYTPISKAMQNFTIPAGGAVQNGILYLHEFGQFNFNESIVTNYLRCRLMYDNLDLVNSYLIAFNLMIEISYQN